MCASKIAESSDSDDGSAPDDEAMFRMDAALAAVFRSKKEQKLRQKEAGVSFISSMLSCVKHFLKHEQANPATVFAAAELAYLIHEVQGRDGFGSVVKMAEACARLALKCRPRNLPEVAPLVEERAMACLKFSAKDRADKSVRRLAGQALKSMVRWLFKVEKDAGIRVLQSIVHSFFGTGKSKLEFLTLVELISETQPFCLGILPTLVGYALNARTSFLQLQAMRVTCHSLNSRERESIQDILKPSLVPLHDYLMYVVGSPFNEKSKNLVALSEATKIVKHVKRIDVDGQNGIELVGNDSLISKIRAGIKEAPPVKILGKLKALEAALKLDLKIPTGDRNIKKTTCSVGLRSSNGGKKKKVLRASKPRKAGK